MNPPREGQVYTSGEQTRRVLEVRMRPNDTCKNMKWEESWTSPEYLITFEQNGKREKVNLKAWDRWARGLPTGT